MLALGKPFERRLPEHILRDLAEVGYRKGEPIERIADDLEATIDEVKMWIQEAATVRLAAEDPFPKYCASDGQRIPIGTPYTREMDRYYHEACARKRMCGG